MDWRRPLSHQLDQVFGADRPLPARAQHLDRDQGLGPRQTGDVMDRKLVSSGSVFEPQIGFSRAVRVGPHIAVSGTAPLLAGGGTACPGDLYGQTKRCLEIIETAIKAAGPTRQHTGPP